MRSIGKINNLGKKNLSDSVTREDIGEDGHDQRIDNFLFKRFKGVPKSHVYQLLRSGQIRVNSKRISASYRLQLNDSVRIPPIRQGQKSVPQHNTVTKFVAFDILFQDEVLLIINKPAGMAVHGGSGVSFGVIEQLRAQYSSWKFLELVHRLDRETSGILLLAKKRSALTELHRQIREGKIQKFYLTLVSGKWEDSHRTVKLPLHKYVSTMGERRVAVVSDKHGHTKAMPAHTIFRLQKSWENFSLLEAELKTGRTHQIRVHLAHLGFPIIGDDKYGDFILNKQIARKSQGAYLQRMFLHAYKIVITHPLSGERLQLEAPLAKDLKEFINRLDESSCFKPHSMPNSADPK